MTFKYGVGLKRKKKSFQTVGLHSTTERTSLQRTKGMLISKPFILAQFVMLKSEWFIKVFYANQIEKVHLAIIKLIQMWFKRKIIWYDKWKLLVGLDIMKSSFETADLISYKEKASLQTTNSVEKGKTPLLAELFSVLTDIRS